MSADINSVSIVGRLVRDAELKYTPGGFAITAVSIASNKSVKRDGSWTEEASFFDCKLLGKRGESLNQYLKKGTQIAISGRLDQERWQSQDGSKRSKVVIIIDNVQLLGGGKQQSSEQFKQNVDAVNNTFGGDDYFDDDVPF